MPAPNFGTLRRGPEIRMPNAEIRRNGPEIAGEQLLKARPCGREWTEVLAFDGTGR